MKCIGALALLLVLAGTSHAQVGDPARGSTLYHITYGCTGCHGDPPNPNVIDDKILLKNGTTAAGILAAINNVAPMIRYTTTLGQSPQDLAQRGGVPDHRGNVVYRGQDSRGGRPVLEIGRAHV